MTSTTKQMRPNGRGGGSRLYGQSPDCQFTTVVFTQQSGCQTLITVIHGSSARKSTHDRRLADGNVHYAGSATYQICFRLPIPNPNPNPITDPDPDPNPKINKKKQNDTRMKLNIVISKSRFPRDGVGL